MPGPGYTADRCLIPRALGPTGPSLGAPSGVRVVAQARWARGYPPISMEECWQACINGIGECPPECAYVPWPTFPPPPPRYLLRR